MRNVQRVLKSIQTREGAGFIVNRPFPVPGLNDIDPFLLIDEIGPVHYGPGQAIGAPDHPHRGFETITYVFEGGVFHEDSHGMNTEVMKGDMQWMTAGRGIIHSELPLPSLQKNGGLFHATQIWVNLPKIKKDIEPKIQNIRARQVPVIKDGENVTIKLFSGDLKGVQGPAINEVPILYALIELEPGASWSVATIDKNWTALAYIINGAGLAAKSNHVFRTDLVQFAKTDGELLFENKSEKENFSFFLLAAAPLNEPIARMGPFVMNTQQELDQAYDDYMHCKHGCGLEPIQRDSASPKTKSQDEKNCESKKPRRPS